ncbi:type I restriction-modification system subunit M N-terminal domain-containing protein [Streptomyces sanyensis]|uniref:type I restriction-modification system subunit M N-terminal domain-containing protein n=1 Tax=Streptomyces sanyensis TaxID=568869 RepID=UPI0031EDFC9C
MEARLWDAADELRKSRAEAQYSSVIFPLMFWKYLSDTWDHNHELFPDAYEDQEGLSKEDAEPSSTGTISTSASRSSTVGRRRESLLVSHPQDSRPARTQRPRSSKSACHRGRQPRQVQAPTRTHDVDPRGRA